MGLHRMSDRKSQSEMSEKNFEDNSFMFLSWRMMKRMILLLSAAGAAAMAGCGPTSCAGPECDGGGFTDAEIALIMAGGPESDTGGGCSADGCISAGKEEGSQEENGQAADKAEDAIMRVLTVDDSPGLSVLRARSSDLSAEALCSENFRILAGRMLSTVTHPSQDGVGIAAPQVGINRRVIAVQRFDKPGEPFEVYADIRIVSLSDSVAVGREGCLSVPGKYGEVERSQEIVIEYADIKALQAAQTNGRSGRRPSERMFRRNSCVPPMATDTIRGFTAVIFQHETDHLDGILYTDKATGLFGVEAN